MDGHVYSYRPKSPKVDVIIPTETLINNNILNDNVNHFSNNNEINDNSDFDNNVNNDNEDDISSMKASLDFYNDLIDPQIFEIL
jgi:hypothetical protein